MYDLQFLCNLVNIVEENPIHPFTITISMQKTMHLRQSFKKLTITKLVCSAKKPSAKLLNPESLNFDKLKNSTIMSVRNYLEDISHELTVSRTVSIVCTLISSVFIIIVLALYFFWRKRFRNFFFELGSLVLIAYIPLMLTAFVINSDESALCNIYGPLRVYSNISVVFWIGILARTVQVTVKKNLDEDDLAPWKTGYLLVGFVPGVLSAVMPFTGGGYAVIHDYCWINLLGTEDFIDWFLLLGFYVLPKIIGTLIIIGYAIDTLSYLRKYAIHRTAPEFKLLVIYPVVFVLYNPVDLFVRIYSTALNQEVPYWLTLVYLFLRQLQGFFYCLAFVLSPKFRAGWWKLCQRRKNDELAVPKEMNDPLPDQQRSSLLGEECVTICNIFKIEVKKSLYQTIG